MDSVYFIFVIIQILVLNESFKVIVLIIVNLIKVDDDEKLLLYLFLNEEIFFFFCIFINMNYEDMIN